MADSEDNRDKAPSKRAKTVRWDGEGGETEAPGSGGATTGSVAAPEASPPPKNGSSDAQDDKTTDSGGKSKEGSEELRHKPAHAPPMQAQPYPHPVPHRVITRQYAGWNIRPNYRMIEMLGHGSYGEVMAAVDITSQRKVAIKRIIDVFRYEMDTRRFLRELHILRRVKHKNVIHLLDLFVHGTENDFDELYLVFEYMDTDLQKLLNSSQHLEDVHIQAFLHQILSGTRYLHSAHVMHRDIKPGNVLVNEDCSIRVCDFGLSRGVSEEMCTYHRHGDAAAAKSTDDPVAAAAATDTTTLPTVVGDAVPVSVAPAALLGTGTSTLPPDAVVTSAASSTSGSSVSGGGGSGSSSAITPKKALRQMTRHVVTRWYRPPEIILTQSYTMAVDVWSIGCIFAELLGMQRAASPAETNYRKPLFPGATCFPLSADSVMTFSSMQDQLNVIFDVIGTPSASDIAALENEAAKKYLLKLPPKRAKSWASLYPSASAAALDLLSRMIAFNPELRITVSDALAHPYLATVANEFKSDKLVAPVTETINVDFAEGISDPAELRKLMLSEISAFHLERQSLFIASGGTGTPK